MSNDEINECVEEMIRIASECEQETGDTFMADPDFDDLPDDDEGWIDSDDDEDFDSDFDDDDDYEDDDLDW